MRKILYLLFVIVILASCSKSGVRRDKEICQAEQLMESNPDSALTILEGIDPSDLKADSLKAKFHYLKAFGHMKRNRSMIGDSLITFAHNYYRGKDIVKDIRSSTAFAFYKFWLGDTPGSIAMLDSLTKLPNVPDSLIVEALRIRVLLGASEYQGRQIIPLAKRLHILENDTLRKMEAKYMLLAGYEYAGEIDSALYLVNELIDYARSHHWGDKQFLFMIEQSQLLTEAGRDDESDRLVGEIFSKAGPDNGAADMLHFQYAINALNRGDVNRAIHHLSIADSLAVKLRGEDNAYFRSYSNLLHAMIEFKQSGRIKLTHINGLNNRQSERFNRMKASQWESERGALSQQNRALILKAESKHKTIIILIISLAAILILGGSAWIFIIRRQRERDNEERIEALQKMVDEYKSAPSQESEKAESSVRSILLKQLGIIKMVAETPTEQNREMLRKISNIDGETNGELVDWEKVFEMIDGLYSGFYSKLHRQYGEQLTPKEEQIIVLMVAGFSTKEISVITGQTTSTIYVRKSSIRKKLGVPEKEDIVEFLKHRGKD
ncbi:MAG: helix-turn-helix transcriptional regulator [Muribaculaceae bacterium]